MGVADDDDRPAPVRSADDERLLVLAVGPDAQFVGAGRPHSTGHAAWNWILPIALTGSRYVLQPSGAGSRASSPGGTGECGTLKPNSANSGAIGRDCFGADHAQKRPAGVDELLDRVAFGRRKLSCRPDRDQQPAAIQPLRRHVGRQQRQVSLPHQRSLELGDAVVRAAFRLRIALVGLQVRGVDIGELLLPDAIERPSGNTRPDQ